MKKLWTAIGMSLLVALLALSAMPAAAAGHGRTPGRIVVANRGSGSITVIDSKTDTVVDTIALPMEAGDADPEPMYVVYSAAKDRVFVGDRANDRVVAFRARDLSLEALVPAGRGVYHMWADPQGKQLWVSNDVDATSSVVDPVTLEILATVPTPADLVAMGGRPHDTMLDPRGRFAYVTVLGLPGPVDYVVQFSTETFEEIGRAAVGKDPHLGIVRQRPYLYVATQGSSQVRVLDLETLDPVTDIAVPGAHGAGMPRNGRFFYTTNLPGGGVDGLWTIDTKTQTLVGDAVDTPYPVPHNLVLTPDSAKLYVTHSGPQTVVTIYTVDASDPVPVYAGEVTVEENPFGLTYVP